MIKRCPTDDCTRMLQNGRSSEYGKIGSEVDRRITDILNDGTTVQDVNFDCEKTEALTGIAVDPGDTARAINYAVTQPAHVDVNEMLIRPTGQV